MILLTHTTHTLTPHDTWRIGTWRISWRQNGCGRIGQQFELTEEVRGRIHVRSPGAAKVGWKI
jgi:hypothetical protein